MITIVDFLLARIAEDEAAVLAASPGVWHWRSDGFYAEGSEYLSLVTSEGPYATNCVIEAWSAYSDGDGLEISAADREHVQRWQPARVLAECRAKRAILRDHPSSDGTVWSMSGQVKQGVFRCLRCCTGEYEGLEDWPCLTIRALASVYADHPDFNPEWRA